MKTEQRVKLPPILVTTPGKPINRSKRHLGRHGRIVVGAVATVALVTTATLTISRVSFERQMCSEVDELLAANRDTQPSVVIEAELTGLPESVQRWLQWSGVIGKERAATVRLTQKGDFRLGKDSAFMPYTAEQHVTTDPPALIWVASFRMMPLVPIRGRDIYRDGTGDIEMRLLSLIPVADKRGGALDQGALLRYLGEMVWYPS